MGTQLFRLSRSFFDEKRVQHKRGAVLPFADPEDEDSKAPRAPSSALLMGSKEEKKLAAKLGVANASVEGPQALSSQEPEPEIDIAEPEGKALSELGKKAGAKK